MTDQGRLGSFTPKEFSLSISPVQVVCTAYNTKNVLKIIIVWANIGSRCKLYTTVVLKQLVFRCFKGRLFLRAKKEPIENLIIKTKRKLICSIYVFQRVFLIQILICIYVGTKKKGYIKYIDISLQCKK